LTCAAAGYLGRFRSPSGIDDFDGHRIVGLRSLTTGSPRTLDFMVGGEQRSAASPTTLSVTGPEGYLKGPWLGLGIAQVPRFHVEEEPASGELIEVLAGTPPPTVPVSLLYPRSRQLLPHVRAFLDGAARAFARRNKSPALV
jgi:DNA-binding transcriptional LysR family regulator